MLDKKNAISVPKIILILMTTEFGFSNVVTGYNQMGYASIIWYVLCAIIFLFPLAMIFGEYSGAIKEDHGGFYTWLDYALGEKWAFIGTVCWVGFVNIVLLQIVSGLSIKISGVLYGKDTTSQWHLGFLNSTEITALIGALFIITVTYFATKGVRKVAITGAIGGIVSLSVISIFTIASVIIFIANGGHLAQPIHGVSSLIKSPNPAFQSPIAIISFAIYAMYAFGGMESTSGFIDKMKNPQKSYPKAIIIAATVVASLYIIGILMCGFATNWAKIMGRPNVNLYSNSYYLFGNLGIGLARSFGLSTAAGVVMSKILVRFLSIGSLLPVLGIMALIYSPIKGLISGSSKDLWPKKVAKFNRHDMPAGAMWIECGIITAFLILIALTGKNGQQFYQIVVDLGNVGSVFPYYFVVIGFIFFKKRHDLNRKVVFFHSMKSTYLVTGMFLTAITFAIVMNLVSPILSHQYTTAFWTFAGPVLFTLISVLMYQVGIRHRAKRMIEDNETFINVK